MKKEHKFPALEQALGGYLHQDFLSDYPNAEEAINAFVLAEPPELIKAARVEIEELIQLVSESPQPGELLIELGCYYDPLADGMSVSGWLQMVERQLSTNG